MPSSPALTRLQEWYIAHCNGDWEHTWGIKIDTLDNPGWRVRIDLWETELENVAFEPVKIAYEHPTNWVTCVVKDGQFHGNCGPSKLEQVLEIFLEWAGKNKPAVT